LIFQGHLNVFWACSWLCCAPADGLTKNVVEVEQNVYPLKQAFYQDQRELFKPIFLQDTNFKVRVKVSYLYETLKIFNDFSRENHGHGGHEQGVRRGVFEGKLSFKKMSAGGRFCTLQENPHFWVPTIKIRPPDGTCMLSIPPRILLYT
jgi:hypothetical protein